MNASIRLAAALLSGLLFLPLSGCQKAPTAPLAQAPIPVATTTVRQTDEPHWIEVLGRAEGGKSVDIRPQVTGILKRLAYKEGDLVKAGDVLFEIDDAPFRAKLDAAQSLTRQRADELTQAEREFKRAKTLFEAGAGSRKDYDDASSARNQASHALSQAKADERDAAINLSWTKVKAPTSGYASKAVVNPGALVDPASTLAAITQHDDVRVTFAPSDRDLAAGTITLKTPVRVFRADGKELAAKLDYVAQAFDVNAGTRLMRAAVPEGSGVIPGEFLTVRLQVSVDKGAFRVPQKAVMQKPDGTYAVFVAQDGKAVERIVTVGLWEGTDWIVRTGLKPGDAVITNQLLKLRNGAPVAAEDAAKKTEAADQPAERAAQEKNHA